MPTIHFIREDIQVEVPHGTNVRDFCRGHGINLYPGPARLMNCRGHGLCGTCLVYVDTPEALSAPGTLEIVKLGAGSDPRYRLACQAEIVGDLRCLTLPHPPQGWHVHSAYGNMKSPDPFEGLVPLSEELNPPAPEPAEAVEEAEEEAAATEADPAGETEAPAEA